MKKLYLVIVFLCFFIAGKVFAQAPIVRYFSPASGPVGTTVTIGGYFFNPSAGNNNVYFGGVKATVTSASATLLTVTVPVGATYKPVSVINTANNLTGYSATPFLLTGVTKGNITAADIDPAVNFTPGYLPQSVYMSDIDGDGKLDIAVANVTSNTVSIFRNIAVKGVINASSLASKVDLAVGSAPANVILQDLDGDGKPDLIVTNKQSNTVSVFHNNSVSGTIDANTFGVKTDFATGPTPTALAVGDIDNDGKPEIVVSGGGVTSIFLNQSTKGSITSASFAPRFDVAGSFNALVLADLDNDSKLDIAGVNSFFSTQVTVLHNAIAFTGQLNALSFDPGVNFTCGSSPVAITAADLNGDGKIDLITADSFDNTISILQNQASGNAINATSFLPRVVLPTGKTPYQIAVDDIDGDGMPDIVVPNYSGNSVSVFHSTYTTGTISASAYAEKIELTTGQFASAAAIGDIDGDGRPDIVVTNNTNSLSVFRNDPTNPPVISSVSPLSGPVGTNVTITGTNFNKVTSGNIVYFGATRGAIVSATTTQLVVTVPNGSTYQPISVLNAETGRSCNSRNAFNLTYSGNTGLKTNDFVSPTGGGILYAYNKNVKVQLSDIDGDGRPDMVTGDIGGTNVTIRLNKGVVGPYVNQFSTQLNFDGGDGIEQIAVGDIDGDGKPDVVTTNTGTHQVSVLINTSTPGNVSFRPRDNFGSTNSNEINFLALADINMDGKLDVIISGRSGPSVSIYKNTSTPGILSFSNKQLITVSSDDDLAVGDVDGDGKPDIIMNTDNGFSNPVGISILRNTSTNSVISFADPVSFSRYGSSFSLADMNGDGKPDIVVNSFNGGGYVLLNTAVPGTITISSLADPINLNVGQNITQGESVADMDGDGKPDIILENLDQFGKSTLTIYRNTLSGGVLSFANGVDIVAAEQPTDLAIGDVDGDGLPDLLVSESYSVEPINYRPQTTFQSSPPQITSITPAAGPIGTIVTISGSNFNAGTIGNIVTFGDVNAAVTAASANSITVKVPAGATYKNVSVFNTATRLFASSPGPFNVTFPSKNSIAASDFNDPVFLHSSATNVTNSYVTMNDVDGDGKLDLVFVNSILSYQFKVTVFRNISSVGVPLNKASFAPGVDFAAQSYDNYYDYDAVTMKDMDGDGKPDMLLAYTYDYSAKYYLVRKNTSTPGNISFDNPQPIATGPGSNVAAIADIDGDGLPDIIAGANFDWKDVSVMRNTSPTRAFQFDVQKSFKVNAGVTSVSVGDLDGDGKPDVMTSNEDGTISVLRNISTAGNITVSSFAPYTNVLTGRYIPKAVMADLDGDGKLDIIAVNGLDSTMSILRNISTTGNISFATKVDFKVGPATDIVINDMDGDGKPDIIVNAAYTGPVVFRNNSSAGSFTASSLQRTDIITGASMCTAVGDLDGDGKPDLVSITGSVISIYQNNPHTPAKPAIAVFGPVTASKGTTVTINGTDFTGTNSVTFGGTAAASFKVLSPKTITAVVAGGSSGSISVTTPLGTGSLAGFTFGAASATPVITPLADTIKLALSSNGTKSITLADVATVTNAGNSTISVSPTSFDCSSTGLKTITVKVSAAGASSSPGAVSFNHPSSVALDVNGNLVVVDANNYRVRKITSQGVVSTVAGNGSTYDTDGPAASASFATSFYSNITTDPFGNIFLTSGETVRKISAQGNVTTIAGNSNNSDGYAYPGPEKAAVFTGPAGIAISPDGTLYVDNIISGHAISKVTQTGIMTLMPGSFNYPVGIALDDAGNLFATNTNTNSIVKLTPSGTLSTVAFNGPNTLVGVLAGIAVDHAGNIYFVDGNAIAKVTTDGYVTILAGDRFATGAFADGAGTSARFDRPGGLCLDNAGNIYVADYNNNRIRKIDPSRQVTTLAGGTQGYADGNIGVTPVSVAALIKAKVSSSLAITNNFPDQALPIDASARAIIPDYTTKVSVTSYCGTAGVKITQSPAAGTFLEAGYSAPVTIMATDTSGLSATKTFNITADGSKTLALNNFQVSATSVTCKGANDGSINIKATGNFNYTATITGNDLNKTITFTTSAAVNNLVPGTYNICIAVPENSNYQQCYSLVITEPQDLSVYSTINDADRTITLAMAGGDKYNIQLNGAFYSTSESSITLPLADGNNNLVVTTDKLCQGTQQKMINISGKMSPYPVPFQNTLYLNLGNTVSDNVAIEINDVSTGKQVYSKQFGSQAGVLQMDVTGLGYGVYVLHLKMGNSEKIFKISKK